MTIDEMGWKVAGAVGGLWLGAVSWIVGKTENRIGTLERDKVNKSTLEKILEDMERRRQEEREEAREARGNILESIGNTNKALGEMQKDVTQTRIDVAGLKR